MAKPPTFTFDTARQLQDAGNVTADALGTRELDLGPGAGIRFGVVVIDISALEIASNDEIYDIILLGSNTSGFGTATGIVELAALNLSAKEVKRSTCDRDDATGRRILPYCNLDEAGAAYRYIRLYILVTGTIDTTGINFTAFDCPIPQKG